MLASTHRLSRGAVCAFGILLAGTMLAGCGINTIPTLQEQAKAAWSEVLNQYQRRADLIPNLVETVKGFADQERTVLTDVVNARAKATQVQAQIPPDILTNPEAMQKFQEA
jgi:LemA protein